jgi:putative inorganic carbon (HCO3(-)) transporter
VTALPEITKPQVYRLLSGILLYYAIVNWAVSGKRLRTVTLGVLLVGIALSMYALVSVEWAVGKWFNLVEVMYQSVTPLVIDTVNPNVMAGSLVLILPVAMGGLFARWGSSSWLYRIVSGCGVVMISGVLVLTLSRGALLAVTLALVVFIAIRWRWGWVFLICASAAAGVAVYQVGFYPLLEAFLSGTSVGSLEGRLELWSRALLLARDFPFSGVGMGMAGEVIQRLLPFSLVESNLITHVHNLYVQVYLDLGFVGFAGWLATLILAVLVAWRVYRAEVRTRRAGWMAGIGAGLFCGQVALALHGFSDAVSWGMVRPAPLVWALWGLVMSMGNITLSQNPSEAD